MTDEAEKLIYEHHPDFVFLYMVETDEKGGHDNGWMSDEYLKYISCAIDNVRRVIEETNGEYTVIVTADHETGGLTVGNGATKNKLLSGLYDDITWEFDDHTDRRVPVFVSAPGGLSVSKLSTSGSGDYMLNKDIFLFMLSCVNQTHVTSVTAG